jgi:Ras-related protein Rab-1A
MMVPEQMNISEGQPTSNMKSNIYKIIIGGDGGIGKTTLLKVFCGECFSNQDMTIGFEIFTKDVFINDSKKLMQIWDLSGQDHFRFLLPDYFKGAHGVILGFDMSRRTSFLNLRTWMTILMAKCPEAPVILIATKADRGYHPTLSSSLAQDFASKFHMLDFLEVSAKNHFNVETPFKRLVEFINNLDQGSKKIKFSKEAELLETLQPGKTPHTALFEENGDSIQPLSTEIDIKVCPHCKQPLRASQIQLKQSGKQILCSNCLKYF